MKKGRIKTKSAGDARGIGKPERRKKNKNNKRKNNKKKVKTFKANAKCGEKKVA